MKVRVQVPCVTFLLAFRVTVDLIGAPCRLSTLGLILQVVLGMGFVQLRFTVPVRPPAGVTVTVNVAIWPEEIVCEAGDTVIVKSPTV